MTMVRRSEPEPTDQDQDERLGAAIEEYLELAEAGTAPDPEVFAERHPDLSDDLLAALDGLALVQGLVGTSGASAGGGSPGGRLETGRRIAGYRIVRELGRGGMGVVYEAVHVALDRPVALKVLGTHAAPDSNGRRRFLNEARTAAVLHHTHIVPVFDVGQVGGLCYYAMQRIEGSGLDRVIRHLRRDRATASGTSSGAVSSLRSKFFLRLSNGGRAAASPARGSENTTGSWVGPSQTGGRISGIRALGKTQSGSAGARIDLGGDRNIDEAPPFEPPRGSAYYRWVAEVGREAAEALAHAHRRGIIHRDVKPSNLLVDGRGLIWVADFGLARRLADPGITQYDSLLGTPRYMSPEQAKVGPIDSRSDLFSLGATLYELLTLRPPFAGQSAAELVEQIGRVEPPAPRQFDAAIPRDLETIVLKLLSKRPGDRYVTADALADDLRRFLNLEPVLARRISVVGRLWRFAQRHPGITAVSTAASVTVLAVTTVAYVRIMHERDQAVIARADAQAALLRQLWREATVVRQSNMPNRRETSLGLIREAAGMRPDHLLRAQLRNEAIESLVLRAVVAREPFTTGRTRALTYTPDSTRLATLTISADGPAVSIWDVAHREKVAERRLAATLSDSGPPARGGNPGVQRPWRNAGVHVLATAGDYLAGLGPDGRSIRFFDPMTAAPHHDLNLNLPGRILFPLLATQDGRRLVTVEHAFAFPGAPRDRAAAERSGSPTPVPGAGPRDRYLVNLWDPEHADKSLATLAQWESDATGPATPLVAISPDGKAVATARGRTAVVSLWSAETGAPLRTIDTQSELTALALGPSNQLATAGSGQVRLWDADSGTAMPSLTPHQSFVRYLRFSPTGSLLAIVGWMGHDVELWDTAAPALAAVASTPDGIQDLVFAPDGQTFAVASQPAPTSGPGALAPSAGQDGTARVWSVVEPVVRVRLDGFDAMTRSMAFRPDGLLALGSYKGTIRFWSEGRCLHAKGDRLPAIGAPPEQEKEREDPAVREGPASLTFDDQGRLITLEPDAVRIWDNPPACTSGASVPLPPLPGMMPGMMRMAPMVIASSRAGQVLAVGRAGQVLLWHSNEPDVLKRVTRLSGPGTLFDRQKRGPRPFRGPPIAPMWRSLAVAPGGDRLYLVDERGGAYAWGLEALEARPLGWSQFPTQATSLALSPDGRLLAVGDQTGRVSLIETAKGTRQARLSPPPGVSEGIVSSLAFTPDGKELAVGSQQGHIDLWSLADTSAPVLRLPGSRGFVASLAFDPQGRQLASAGSDKTVDVWNIDRIHQELKRLSLEW
jgi:serine/threonine protein kinase/WD40 repeat protein